MHRVVVVFLIICIFIIFLHPQTIFITLFYAPKNFFYLPQYFDLSKAASSQQAPNKLAVDTFSHTDYYIPQSQMEDMRAREAERRGLEGSESSEDEAEKKRSADTPSLVSYASYDHEAGLLSPQGYPLKKWTSDRFGYLCDGCEVEQDQGVVLFSSREESYDICYQCALKMAHGYGTPKDLVLQELERISEEDIKSSTTTQRGTETR